MTCVLDCSTARSCQQPLDPAHGWHAGECYTFGCRVTYHCAEGYELVGKLERFCQADGSWTPKELPSCVCEYTANNATTMQSTRTTADYDDSATVEEEVEVDGKNYGTFLLRYDNNETVDDEWRTARRMNDTAV